MFFIVYFMLSAIKHYWDLNVCAFIPGVIAGVIFPPTALTFFVLFQLYAVSESYKVAQGNHNRSACDDHYFTGPRGGVYRYECSSKGVYKHYV